MIFIVLLTWIIPAGSFSKLNYNSDKNIFEYSDQIETIELPSTQSTLDSLSIKIPLDKFTSGSIWKPIGVPGTYQKVPSQPQGLTAAIQAPIKGIYEAMDVILFVLIIGGFIGIVQFTGMFDIGISWLTQVFSGREYWLIVIVTTLIALGGTSFGLAEETIAFFPILIPILASAGYDRLTTMSTLFLGSSIGTTASTVNPFSTIIASDAAGIVWTDGLNGRLFMLILMLVVTIAYILWYSNRVKKDPSRSLVDPSMNVAPGASAVSRTIKASRTSLILTFAVFTFSFLLMIVGVSMWDWWFLEMTTIFFIASILIAFIVRIDERLFVKEFIAGTSSLLGVALIIGFARGVTVIMESGMISDTILEYSRSGLSGLPSAVFVNVALFIFALLSFFVPSSSGLAVLSMPVFAPLGDMMGVDRSLVVDAYQFGSGIFHIINPTGLLLPSLAIAGLNFKIWFRFIWPLFAILLLLAMIFLTMSVWITAN